MKMPFSQESSWNLTNLVNVIKKLEKKVESAPMKVGRFILDSFQNELTLNELGF